MTYDVKFMLFYCSIQYRKMSCKSVQSTKTLNSLLDWEEKTRKSFVRKNEGQDLIRKKIFLNIRVTFWDFKWSLRTYLNLWKLCISIWSDYTSTLNKKFMYKKLISKLKKDPMWFSMNIVSNFMMLAVIESFINESVTKNLAKIPKSRSPVFFCVRCLKLTFL